MARPSGEDECPVGVLEARKSTKLEEQVRLLYRVLTSLFGDLIFDKSEAKKSEGSRWVYSPQRIYSTGTGR